MWPVIRRDDGVEVNVPEEGEPAVAPLLPVEEEPAGEYPSHFIEVFLRSLFEFISAGQWILVWSLKDKFSRWFDNWIDAASWVTDNSEDDLYIGCGLSPQKKDEKSRCKIEEVSGISALWMDLDMASPHRGKGHAALPATLEEAMEVVDGMPLPPSMIVHSGYGLHVWWLFREPWMFDSAEERGRAAGMVTSWAALAREGEAARKHGWNLDVTSTTDLARILRIPGTLNKKDTGNPRRVALLSDCSGPLVRYNPEDFDYFLPQASRQRVATGEFSRIQITLNPHAELPKALWDALVENDPQILLILRHQWRDPSWADESGSAFDMSLASRTAAAGWPDQQICDLLVYHRRLHNYGLKRLDYYQRTIARARQPQQQGAAPIAANPIVEADAAPAAVEASSSEFTERVVKNGGASPEEKAQALALLHRMMPGAKILRVVKYQAGEPEYRLETTYGQIFMGDVGALVEFQRFRKKVAACSDVALEGMKVEVWNKISQALLTVCDVEDIGPEATDRGMVAGWMSEYMIDRPVQESLAEAIDSNCPWKDKHGNVFLVSSQFRKWLQVSQAEKDITPQRMGKMLKAYGCYSAVLTLDRGDGSRTSISAWKLPKGQAGGATGVPRWVEEHEEITSVVQ